jgi:threonine synthase
VFDASGRDPATVRAAMAALQQSGAFGLDPNGLRWMRDQGFAAGRANESEVTATLRAVLDESGYRLDPHTATAVHASRQSRQGGAPMVILATAHPAKFPDAVRAATGELPALPDWLADLMDRPEKFSRLPNDPKIVEDFIREKRRT